MHKRAVLLCCLVSACVSEGAEQEAPAPVDDPLAYVDPRIGSGGFGYAFGSAFPGASAPSGLCKVGPDTSGPYGTINFLHYSGYWYGDHIVRAFSHMHLHGTGATDYGVLGIVPSAGFAGPRADTGHYGAPFRKETESARPGYYAVTLDPGGGGAIRVELTATVHAAHHVYVFQGIETPTVIIDLDHHLESGEITSAEMALDRPGRRLRGRLHSRGGMSGGYGGYDVFFEIRTRSAWEGQLLWKEGAPPAPGVDVRGRGVGAALTFASGAPVELKVGLSLVSVEGAAANLDAEMPSWDFAAARRGTEAAWRAILGTLRVHGGSHEDRRIFYSALYRSFLMPSVNSDVDGRFLGHDGKVAQLAAGRFLSDFSLWDTYRTLHPLYALIAPALAAESVRSLHEMARARGVFPKWPLAGGDSGVMIGASAEVVVADAYARGVRDFDATSAYETLRAAALSQDDPPAGRGGRDAVVPYMKLGYVPARIGSSVSLTTEYAHNDFALAGLAAALGREDDARALIERSRGYRKLFDAGTGFLRARDEAGALEPGPFDPLCFCRPYREANAWQSVWMAAHDAEGLAALFGGPGAFVARLEEFFERARADLEESDRDSVLANAMPRPYYWAGNQPDIHAAYLFAQVGRPDLTQRWAGWARRTFFRDAPHGLPGNDDGGTMSAWYLFSALGLYPIPGSDRYIIGTPLFPRVEVAVPGGTFIIEAEGASRESLHVQSVTLDGQPWDAAEIRHAELRPGRTLRFRMGPYPGLPHLTR